MDILIEYKYEARNQGRHALLNEFEMLIYSIAQQSTSNYNIIRESVRCGPRP